jgi:predicted amidohydrolase
MDAWITTRLTNTALSYIMFIRTIYKDSLVIQPSGEIISHAALQSDVIVFDEEKRQKVIQILRQIPAFVDVVKKLSSEEKT